MSTKPKETKKWPELEEYLADQMAMAVEQLQSPDDFYGEFDVEEKDAEAFAKEWADAYEEALASLWTRV